MSGRDLLRSDGQIRAVKLALDLFCRTFVFLASGSREASNFEPGAGTVTCFCEFSGQKRPEPGWRNLEWAHLYQLAFTRQELARSLVSDNG